MNISVKSQNVEAECVSKMLLTKSFICFPFSVNPTLAIQLPSS